MTALNWTTWNTPLSQKVLTFPVGAEFFWNSPNFKFCTFPRRCCLQTTARTRSTSCCRSATPSVLSISTRPIRRRPAVKSLAPCASAVTRRVCCVAAQPTTTASTVQFTAVWQRTTSVLMSTSHIVACRCSSLSLFLRCRSPSSASRLSLSGCGCSSDDLPTGYQHSLHGDNINNAVSFQSTFTTS